ncbi:hypothetical protein [Marinactinospora rubrisoli]|uniref:Uncharacterized protein n=1 Tax=Marinactinospora rubrisoli TaxID=2715399 RepID=A0ABW2KIB3_9ACTN
MTEILGAGDLPLDQEERLRGRRKPVSLPFYGPELGEVVRERCATA